MILSARCLPKKLLADQESINDGNVTNIRDISRPKSRWLPCDPHPRPLIIDRRGARWDNGKLGYLGDPFSDQQGSNPGYGNKNNVGYSPGQSGTIPAGWAKFKFQMRQYLELQGYQDRLYISKYPLTAGVIWSPLTFLFAWFRVAAGTDLCQRFLGREPFFRRSWLGGRVGLRPVLGRDAHLRVVGAGASHASSSWRMALALLGVDRCGYPVHQLWLLRGPSKPPELVLRAGRWP